MQIARLYTHENNDPFHGVGFSARDIGDDTGLVMPETWGDAACEAFVRTAFSSGERDMRAVLQRLAGDVIYQGIDRGYFPSREDARAFHDELIYILLHQIAAFNGAPAPAWPREMNLLDQVLGEGQTAQPVVLTLRGDHPKILRFIGWKAAAEMQTAITTIGRKVLSYHLHAIMDACDRGSLKGFDPAFNPALKRAIAGARLDGMTEGAVSCALLRARGGDEDFPELKMNRDYDDSDRTAFAHVKTKVVLTDDMVEGMITNHKGGQELLEQMAQAVWSSGEPGLIFEDTARAFSFDQGEGRRCATLNLLKFSGTPVIDAEKLAHAARVLTVALDILSADGGVIGYCNLAALLMGQGIPYDSTSARDAAAIVTGLVSASAFQASAVLAEKFGGCCDPAVAAEAMGVKLHALTGMENAFRGWLKKPYLVKNAGIDPAAHAQAVTLLKDAITLCKKTGLKNSCVTGLDADLDTAAMLGAQTLANAPETTLVRFEGYGRNLNPQVPRALKKMGYNAAEIDDIYFYAVGHGTLLDAPFINHKTLAAKGFCKANLDALESALKVMLHIRYAFNKWTLSEDFCLHALGLSRLQLDSPGFDMLAHLGFTEDEIEAANLYCSGAGTLEGAPHLQPDHYAVFDCLNSQGGGVRSVSPLAQIKMAGAVTPYVAGAAPLTLTVDPQTLPDEIASLMLKGWEHGLKTLSLYRAGSGMADSSAQMVRVDGVKETEMMEPEKMSVAR